MKTKTKETLVDRARKVSISVSTSLIDTATEEQIELAIAWAKDEIRLGQISQVLWDKTTARGVGGKTLYTLACWLKAGILKGRIKV